MTPHLSLRSAFCSLLLSALCSLPFASVLAQTATATLSGTVTDEKGAVVPGVTVTAENPATSLRRETTTNGSGYFTIPLLPPSTYTVTVEGKGFTPAQIKDVVLNVGDNVALNIQLKVGEVGATVDIREGAPLLNTESAAVSTVVDRNFAENLPLNGRSFQTLIQLTPGVVLTATNTNDTGQFSVNGQRAAANYWLVDGVGANIGVAAAIPGNGFSGALGAFSAQGGTNSLVSVDAMQEFRIQTSTYAPEFGRTPGGQISIVTRAGTNQFHGTLFDYFRNDFLDANDWFANANNLPKPKERQNDFGGTLSGPVLKDKTFFFFSYEGLRLRLPRTALTSVPDLAARQNAIPAMQPFLNAYPKPNGPDNAATGVAQFNGSFSASSSLDAYSIRVDHKVSNKISVFGRYNYSPSDIVQRGDRATSLNTISSNAIKIHTVTGGVTWSVSARTLNDLRFNYSRVNSDSFFTQDNFGGAAPLASLPFPNSVSGNDGQLFFGIISLISGASPHWVLGAGKNGHNLQRQINVVDNVTAQRGSHSLKFGIDFRRLSPLFDGPTYEQQPFFLNVSQAEAGNLLLANVLSGRSANLLFRNLGVFAQDTWRITPRLTVTYGLRSDVDFAPDNSSGPNLPALTGFNLNDFSHLALAPGEPPYKTTYGMAPRVGIAYQLRQDQNWNSVLRGGFGVFYDLADSEAGGGFATFTYPFGATHLTCCFIPFPLNSSAAAPPAITASNITSAGMFGFDPNLKLPYTLQWNVTFEQALGSQQNISLSYVGSVGRRLLQSSQLLTPNPAFAYIFFTLNSGSSDYDALQVQFRRPLARRLQALASYTWSHSIDTASAGSVANSANAFLPSAVAQSNRGPSDFDTRHAFSAALTYDVPSPKANAIARAALSGWSLQSVIQVRSATPVNVSSFIFNGSVTQYINGYFTLPRPDVVPGQPFYLFGSQYPGGKAFNPAAFAAPPMDASGNVLRQGNLPRNALRGFGAAQWDFAIHRDFPIHESLKLQFRAEMFNVLNHPNFAPPDGLISDPTFGKATEMLGQGLAGGQAANGSFSPLYQIGGPRSMQFALKLIF